MIELPGIEQLRWIERVGVVDELNNGIDEQNAARRDLLETPGVVTVEPFRQAVEESLQEVQAETVAHLGETQAGIPYEKIGAYSLRVSAEEVRVAEALDSCRKEAVSEHDARIKSEAESIVARIPALASKLGELSLGIDEIGPSPEIITLEAELKRLQTARADVDVIFEITGRAWPIPRATDTRPSPKVLVRDEEVSQEDVSGVCISPDEVATTEPEIISTKETDEDALRYAPNETSELFAMILAENPGQVFDLREIAQIIFGATSDETQLERISHRVHVFVSNQRLGKNNIIGQWLEAEGLVLQSGMRRKYDKATGRSIGKAKSVYRAVPFAGAYDFDEELFPGAEVDELVGKWRLVTYPPETPSSPELSLQGTSELLMPDQEVQSSDEDPAQVQVSHKGVSGKTSGVVEKDSVVEPEWRLCAKQQIRGAITQLEECGLMQEKPVSWKVLARKSASRKMGTRTMAQRARANHIITEEESRRTGELSIQKLVLVAAQNGLANLFGNRATRAEVIKMVNAEVKAYFRAKKSLEAKV